MTNSNGSKRYLLPICEKVGYIAFCPTSCDPTIFILTSRRYERVPA